MSSLLCCWCVSVCVCVYVWVCVYIHTYVFVCEQEEGQNKGGTQEVNDIPDLSEGWKRRCVVCCVGLQCLEIL